MLKIWMVDFAREQAPSLDHLYQYASVAQEAGYDALGMYLEHRFAYPSTPWAHGQGCIQSEHIKALRSEFPSLRIIPFINLLGHVEGFMYAERGWHMAEETLKGLQACACNPDFVSLCNGILEDTLTIFDDELVHLGGDETAQLGVCPKCSEFVEQSNGDGKAALYLNHFLPFINRVKESGKTPALWGDMLLEHPEALAGIPKETVIFDWQYFRGVEESAPKFIDAGLKVVACPTLHMYNASWMHLEKSDQNVREHAQQAHTMNLEGLCLTTWEATMFSSFDSTFPAVKAAAKIFDEPISAPPLRSGYAAFGQRMGDELNEFEGFKLSRHRSKQRCRFLLYGNPFLLWAHHRPELCGEPGKKLFHIAEEAIQLAEHESWKSPAFLLRGMVEFCSMAEEACRQYELGYSEQAIAALFPSLHLFDQLKNVANHNQRRIGSGFADAQRCEAAKSHIMTVIKRLREFGDGQLGYKPAFPILTHHNFMPHDQGSWWLINNWGR